MSAQYGVIVVNNKAHAASMAIHYAGPGCDPEAIIIAMGGKQSGSSGLYSFDDGSMVTDRGVEYIGGAA